MTGNQCMTCRSVVWLFKVGGGWPQSLTQRSQYESLLMSHRTGDKFLYLPSLVSVVNIGERAESRPSPHREGMSRPPRPSQGSTWGRTQVLVQEAVGTLFRFRGQPALGNNQEVLGARSLRWLLGPTGRSDPCSSSFSHPSRAVSRGDGHPPIPVSLDYSPQSPRYNIKGTDHTQRVQN